METPQRVIIRRATSADVASIMAITDAAYARYIPRMGRKPQPMTVDYQLMLTTNPIWLLCVADQPVGVLALIHEPTMLLLYSVAVHPDYQRRGFGQQLLAWSEHEARRAGYTHIRLYTNALMEENIARYIALGYRETGREAFEGLTIVHFAKNLTFAAG
jgi:ribosomal protein S18 acetylase RimI-like enzyme